LLLDLDYSVLRAGKGPTYANRKEVITTGDTVESIVVFLPPFKEKLLKCVKTEQF
jgi:hypothetical protein